MRASGIYQQAFINTQTRERPITLEVAQHSESLSDNARSTFDAGYQEPLFGYFSRFHRVFTEIGGCEQATMPAWSTCDIQTCSPFSDFHSRIPHHRPLAKSSRVFPTSYLPQSSFPYPSPSSRPKLPLCEHLSSRLAHRAQRIFHPPPSLPLFCLSSI